MSLHRRTVHPVPVADCFGCKVSSLQFATAPTDDTQAASYRFQANFAKEFHNGDREAYRRLRANGEQPPSIAGSAHLERHAETSFEISSGRVGRDQKALGEALRFAADHGLNPMEPATTPVES